MQIFQRLKMGVVLTKDSLLVMRHNPKLFLFPLVSGVAGLAFLAIFLGTTFGLMAISPEGGVLVGLFLIYIVLTFVSTFFTAALVHQTREVLGGNEPSLKAGLAAAWDVKGPLFVWSVISATVGLIINAIESSDSPIGRAFGVIFGIAWTLMTFFIVPSIVFEKASTKEMFTRSAGTFKQTWGETPISLFGISIVSTLVALPFALPGVLLLDSGLLVPGVGLVIAGFVLSFLVSQTLQGVVKTTLYLYAREGKRPEEFDNVDFDNLATSSAGKSSTGGPKYGGFQ